jgi:hypothetical protein
VKKSTDHNLGFFSGWFVGFTVAGYFIAIQTAQNNYLFFSGSRIEATSYPDVSRKVKLCGVLSKLHNISSPRASAREKKAMGNHLTFILEILGEFSAKNLTERMQVTRV